MVAKETLETRYQEQWVAASDMIAAMNRAFDSRDEEARRLLDASTQAQASIAQSQAEQVGSIAHAYTTGVHHAAQQARCSQPRSNAMSESPNSVRHFDLIPIGVDVLTAQPLDPLTTNPITAAATNLSAKAGGSDRPTGAPTATAGSVSGASVS